ncbi:MAG: hypothetical protein JRD93_19930 [Deltaproteobacteria bacterium]|nr:hypothetical protein [Deltaproteobacteria bacterium]
MYIKKYAMGFTIPAIKYPKAVTPVKTGVQMLCKSLKRLDSAKASLRARLSPE